MSILFIWLVSYLVIGVAVTIWEIYTHFYSEGIDFTVDDFKRNWMGVLIWPILLFLRLWDLLGAFFAKRNGVLIPGSKSVKVEKALRK